MLIEGGEERREKDEFIHVEDERVDVYFIRSIRHYIVSQGKVGSRERSSCKFIYIRIYEIVIMQMKRANRLFDTH